MKILEKWLEGNEVNSNLKKLCYEFVNEIKENITYMQIDNGCLDIFFKGQIMLEFQQYPNCSLLEDLFVYEYFIPFFKDPMAMELMDLLSEETDPCYYKDEEIRLVNQFLELPQEAKQELLNIIFRTADLEGDTSYNVDANEICCEFSDYTAYIQLSFDIYNYNKLQTQFAFSNKILKTLEECQFVKTLTGEDL